VDKGHRAEWKTFANLIRNGGQSPISFNELLNSTLATFALIRSSSDGSWVDVSTEKFLNYARHEFLLTDFKKEC
jgi:hypothetical protein